MSAKDKPPTEPAPPEARSGLPAFLERTLVGRLGGSPLGRVGAAAGLRALGVLVRRHPRAALDAALAGAVQGGRAGIHELRRKLAGTERARPAADAETIEDTRLMLEKRFGRRKLQKLAESLRQDLEAHRER